MREGVVSIGEDRTVFLTLCLATSLSVLTSLSLSPFLPAIGGDLNTSTALLGQAVMVSSLVGGIVGLAIGPSAEWLGYRRLLLLGLIALVMCNVGIALAPAFGFLVAAQLLSGLSAATISPMAFAIAGIRYHGDVRRQVISRMFASASVASIVGFPILTFIASQSSWRWSFVALAFIAVAGLVFTAATLDADVISAHEPLRLRALLATYVPLLRHPPVALVYAAQFCRGVAWTGLLTYIGAFLVEQMGRSLQEAGLIWLALGPGFMTGSLLVSGPLRHIPARRTFFVTVLAMGALIAVVFVVQPPILLTWATLLGAAFFGGIAEVTAVTIMSGETPTTQGTTMALNSSITRFGTAVGALTGGLLLAVGNYSALGLGLPLVALAAALVCMGSGRGTTAGRAVREGIA
ncbi:MAG TPA: MFS transporter [Thermomicrobiales bacterium]|nr:MFS transporter [Thermomicrobiales bacterium]HQZ90583.1 MFS transporter [Thermomicrobiales bacterium]HRA31995.1 MFS transporter [Thermomicrobiales bacterium]